MLGNPVLMGVVLGVNVVVLFGVAFWARGRTETSEDYLVAGRRLGLPLATATLFATWFGAGTLLVATQEVRVEGIRAAALDPVGAGLCLILAGAFFAGPLWRMRLLTVVDFYRVRFGPRAEKVAGVLMVPGYFGWIAAQFVALASVLELLLGLDFTLGLVLVAVVGAGYTLIGGMWSVAATDALQAVLLIIGLVVMLVMALLALGHGEIAAGSLRLIQETPAPRLAVVPTEDLESLLGWLSLLAAGALGNLPGQDLMQRVLSSRSERVARRACWLAGIAYLLFGAIPVALGLAAALLVPGDERAILPVLADLLVHPVVSVLFVLALVSAVLSTIDSAILAPAGVIAENLLATSASRARGRFSRDEAAVLGVAAASLAVAFLGETAYSLLESAYEIGLVSLLVPLTLGLAFRRGGEAAALAAMGVGTGLWLVHLSLGWAWFAEPWLYDGAGLVLPVGLTCAACGLLAYLAAARAEAPSPDPA